MAVPPYNVWVQAYAGSGNSESPTTPSEDMPYAIGTVYGLEKTGSYLGTFRWNYDPATSPDIDDFAGWKLYIGKSPTPNWGTAIDLGTAVVQARPSETYDWFVQQLLYPGYQGFYYAAIQAYGHHGGTAESNVIEFILPATLPATVPVLGLNPSTQSGLIATDVEFSPAGASDKAAQFSDGTPICFGCTILTGTATLDFPSMAANTQQTLTITVSGAKIGDIAYACPDTTTAMEAGFTWCASVSAANTVQVRLTKDTTGTVDPASRTWRVVVLSF